MRFLGKLMKIIVFTLFLPACGKVENPVGPSNPYPFQPVKIRFLDGAGNSGPLTLHLLELLPGPGAIRPNSIEFKAEICMDPISGHDSPFFSQMRLVSLQSDDGPTPKDQTDSAFDWNGEPFIVRSGECITIKIPRPILSRPGSYYQYTLQPGTNYLLFAAGYGPHWPSSSFVNWGNLVDRACPPFDVIEKLNSTPACILRAAYFLEYTSYS